MEREKQIVQLLHDVRGILSYQQSCSITEYPEDTALSVFLNDCSWQVSAPATEHSLVLTPVKSGKSDQKKLNEIAAEVTGCSACSLSEQRACVVPGTGKGSAIRLLIVGHWLPASENSKAVFGTEEDLMLQRMLSAIKLPLEQVFITNVIKCAVSPEVQPQSEHIDACSSFLAQQIAAIAPELICAMGMVATKSLLRLPQSLSQLRGRFHNYRNSDGFEIPLLPTYHPGYLLQNPEMKQATWHDLQVLEKRLANTNR